MGADCYCLGLQSNSAEPKRKKSHSALGHLWKTIKNDFLNPKAAAADFQKLSVSAVRQATVVMSSVAENAEAEMTNLHDQLLGGKRNLPDHAGEHLGCNVMGTAAAICVTLRKDLSCPVLQALLSDLCAINEQHKDCQNVVSQPVVVRT